MRYILVLGALMLAVAPSSHAEAYRCQAEDGHVIFSDEPCGDNAETIELETDSPKKGPSGSASSAKDTGQPEDETSQTSTGSGDAGGEPSGKPAGNESTAQAPDNPCLNTRSDNEVMQGGTSESRIRAACGTPNDVTTGNEVFDKTLHYGDDDRKMQIFIRDGAKVGHNAL